MPGAYANCILKVPNDDGPTCLGNAFLNDYEDRIQALELNIVNDLNQVRRHEGPEYSITRKAQAKLAIMVDFCRDMRVAKHQPPRHQWLPRGGRDHIGERDTVSRQSATEKVVRVVAAGGPEGVSRGNLTRALQSIPIWERENAIRNALAMGMMIETRPDVGPKGGRPKAIYRTI